MLDSTSRIVALIPARSGSKRLPGKNKKLLAGKPLIQWSIESALASEVFAKVLVSTDDTEIAAVSRAAGADVPWLRPAHLSTDTASSADVVSHTLSYLLEVEPQLDAVMLLQPTSPFRSVSSIQKAVSVFNQFEGNRSIVSVSPIRKSLSWCRWRGADGKLSSILQHVSSEPNQAYIFNGLIYLASFNSFFAHHGFLNDETYGLITEGQQEAVDIDDEIDWKIAEFFAAQREVA